MQLLESVQALKGLFHLLLGTLVGLYCRLLSCMGFHSFMLVRTAPRVRRFVVGFCVCARNTHIVFTSDCMLYCECASRLACPLPACLCFVGVVGVLDAKVDSCVAK